MQIYDEQGNAMIGEGLPSIPVTTTWLKESLQKNLTESGEMTAEEVYANVTAVANHMNSVSHIFCKETDRSSDALTSEQRLAAINMMFHLARHEYSNAIKEFIKCIGTENRRLFYNEAILFSILADAFENTMTYRKHRPADTFSKAASNLTVLRDNENTAENIQDFIMQFRSRISAEPLTDACFIRTQDALLTTLILLVLDDGMQPKHEKNFRYIEDLMMKRYYPGDREIAPAADYLKSLIPNGASGLITSNFKTFEDTPAVSQEAIWTRTIADIHAVLN